MYEYIYNIFIRFSNLLCGSDQLFQRISTETQKKHIWLSIETSEIIVSNRNRFIYIWFENEKAADFRANNWVHKLLRILLTYPIKIKCNVELNDLRAWSSIVLVARFQKKKKNDYLNFPHSASQIEIMDHVWSVRLWKRCPVVTDFTFLHPRECIAETNYVNSPRWLQKSMNAKSNWAVPNEFVTFIFTNHLIVLNEINCNGIN